MKYYLLSIVTLLLLAGCSKSSNPVSPNNQQTAYISVICNNVLNSSSDSIMAFITIDSLYTHDTTFQIAPRLYANDTSTAPHFLFTFARSHATGKLYSVSIDGLLTTNSYYTGKNAGGYWSAGDTLNYIHYTYTNNWIQGTFGAELEDPIKPDSITAILTNGQFSCPIVR